MAKTVDIEVKINKMIDKVMELGHEPKELWLKTDDYNELFKKVNNYMIEGIEVKSDGVVWNDGGFMDRLTEYKGMKIHYSDITKIVW